jgi:DNA-binding Xre family transcriptional regulator
MMPVRRGGRTPGARKPVKLHHVSGAVRVRNLVRGRLVYRIRCEIAWQQTRLAEWIGVFASDICHMETGAVGSDRFGATDKICAKLGLDAEYLSMAMLRLFRACTQLDLGDSWEKIGSLELPQLMGLIDFVVFDPALPIPSVVASSREQPHTTGGPGDPEPPQRQP